jgi:hypothetical protein
MESPQNHARSILRVVFARNVHLMIAKQDNCARVKQFQVGFEMFTDNHKSANQPTSSAQHSV